MLGATHHPAAMGTGNSIGKEPCAKSLLTSSSVHSRPPASRPVPICGYILLSDLVPNSKLAIVIGERDSQIPSAKTTLDESVL